MELQQSEINEAYEFVTEELGRNARFETFSKRIQPTYERLIEAAQGGQKITYGELADYADTNHRRYMSKLLDGIGYIEESRGNPPTTVIVVHSGEETPADEFLHLVDVLGIRHRYEFVTDEELITEMTDEVFSHYRTEQASK